MDVNTPEPVVQPSPTSSPTSSNPPIYTESTVLPEPVVNEMSMEEVRHALNELMVYYPQQMRLPALKTKLNKFMVARREQIRQDTLALPREAHALRPFPFDCPIAGGDFLLSAENYPLLQPALSELSQRFRQPPIKSHYSVYTYSLTRLVWSGED